MTQCMLGSLPNWIQALAAICIVGLTLATLIVLKNYAADTKSIARASVSQLENSQMPFITVVLRPNPPDEGWGLENQGFGPAINGSLSYVQNGRHTFAIPSLSSGSRYNIHNAFAGVVGNQAGVEIQYESLSGRKYRTLITWGERGVIQTRFEGPVNSP